MKEDLGEALKLLHLVTSLRASFNAGQELHESQGGRSWLPDPTVSVDVKQH